MRPGLDEIRKALDLAAPYGVPTGVVLRPTARDDAINKCIDGYLLMERKARAWDALQAKATTEGWAKVIATMDALLS